ncbi:hypothetical protein [Chenggangzhangella methanolivorans]|uniref:Uncharacterized protein n=1 Tax=Chenggangzhangella methanolivorans TaxID=1437009 RepID=A0A9E6R645_9HYPH|nr:hypothetical protein [Chenggangzhangella methanolivorans]QZN98524.1 hypothetical protein K6K41_15915 [Chenggangzhangella methanolivorans]
MALLQVLSPCPKTRNAPAVFRPSPRGRPCEAVRRACRHAQAPAPSVERQGESDLLRRLAGPAVVIVAALAAVFAVWATVLKPIEVAADALGGMFEVVAPDSPETPQLRLARAERDFGAATSKAARSSAASDRAEAARRLTLMEAARDAAAQP